MKINKNLPILAFIIGLLFFFKKDNSVGSVDVGEGDFGDFDSDGDFVDTDDLKTPDFIPSSTPTARPISAVSPVDNVSKTTVDKTILNSGIIPDSIGHNFNDFGLKPVNFLKPQEECI